MENEINKFQELTSAEEPSCDPTVSRKEFLQKILKGAAVAGTLLAAPKVLDKFLIPAAYATTSSCNTADTASCASATDSAGGMGVGIITAAGRGSTCDSGEGVTETLCNNADGTPGFPFFVCVCG